MKIEPKTFKGITDLLLQFPTEKVAAQYWASLRWPHGAVCPYCFSNAVYVFADGIRYQCKEKTCKQIFSIRVGTIMENSKLPIRKWLVAMYLLLESSKGISSVQLAEMVGTSQKTSWFMMHRIRAAMEDKTKNLFSGIVEADATFVGGKMKNMHASKRAELSNKAGFVHLIPVFGLIQRGGKVMTKVIESESGQCVKPIIVQHVVPKSVVVTDGATAFKTIPQKDYHHRTVNHSIGEYARGCWDSNSIESFWAVLKRGYVGIYHYWSPQHLNRYLSEFTFRHNLRNGEKNSKFNTALKQSERRLTWKMLTEKL